MNSLAEGKGERKCDRGRSGRGISGILVGVGQTLVTRSYLTLHHQAFMSPV